MEQLKSAAKRMRFKNVTKERNCELWQVSLHIVRGNKSECVGAPYLSNEEMNAMDGLCIMNISKEEFGRGSAVDFYALAEEDAVLLNERLKPVQEEYNLPG